MVYKIFIKIIFFLFISLNSLSNILYDNKGLIITDIELNIYKDFYFNYHKSEISDANSLKDLVLIKNVIRDLKENNSDFITKIDNEITSQFGVDIHKNETILNFYRFSRIRDEFIYNYFRNELRVEEIENIFKNLNELNLPISDNNCLVINNMVDLKNNREFINNFYFNLKNNTNNYELEINGLSYDVCIDKAQYFKIEQLIVSYIRSQTDKEFEYFVYEKIRN
tara:strand:- start:6316 stop:6987 length:672 start_codon:yes stop_codon:yes gene_type:complete